MVPPTIWHSSFTLVLYSRGWGWGNGLKVGTTEVISGIFVTYITCNSFPSLPSPCSLDIMEYVLKCRQIYDLYQYDSCIHYLFIFILYLSIFSIIYKMNLLISEPVSMLQWNKVFIYSLNLYFMSTMCPVWSEIQYNIWGNCDQWNVVSDLLRTRTFQRRYTCKLVILTVW